MSEGHRGRPRKHLQEEHHFRTSDETATAGAPPVADESDQADAGTVDIVSNPTSAEHTSGGIGSGETATITVPESPIEEKIHQLVDNASLNGWHPIDTEIVLEMPPRNGMPVRLSGSADGEIFLCIWKKTRKFANTTHRWQEGGKWVHFESGMDINFQPKYWKERF